MTFVLYEDCMGCSNQGLAIRPDVEGNGKHEALWFDGMLVHSSLVPGFVHGSNVFLAKVPNNETYKDLVRLIKVEARS